MRNLHLRWVDLKSRMSLEVADDDLYLVMDGHAAGRVVLEDFGHPIGEPLVLELGLLLAVLLLVEKGDS